jgi:hypothetical protein
MHFLPEQLTGLPESSDRRGRVRRNPSAIAYLDVGEGNGGIVLNVSETGVAIAVAQALTDDEIPLLSFRLPQLDRTFQAGGEVVWRSATNKTAGVRFVNLEERDRSQIRNWIRAEIVEHELKAPMGHAGEARAEGVSDASNASGGANTPTAGEAAVPAPKTVLVMPSRAARKAAKKTESEAERDEARAAEFDRMFPSEVELANLSPVEGPVTLGPVVGSEARPELFDPADHENVELAAEAFLAARELQTEEAVGDNAPSAERIEIRDWREEWEQFHVERENLEKVKSSETGWELPRPFSAPMPEEAMVCSPADQGAAATETLGDVAPVASVAAEESGDAAPRRVFVRNRAEGLDWYQSPQGGAPVVDAYLTPADPSVGEAAQQAAGAIPPKTEKVALSIAALCMMLVLMCFILGYAIQPGSFRLSSMKDWFAAREAADVASLPQNRPASGQVPTAVDPPTSVVTPDANQPAVTAPNSVAPETVAPKSPAPVVTSAPRAASDAATRVASPNLAPPITPDNAPTAAVEATPAPAAVAASNASDLTIDAPVPVSFFPVTAPAEGSPAKLMQLPEETVSQTHDIVIRSHQFLFVPPLPGPEATHELERVHLGDRLAKIDPGFAPQAVEQFKGSSIHLRSTIGADGKVADVQAISGPTSLIPAAVNAVRQWRYKPTDIDGKPIAIEEDIVIEVRPSHS